MDLRGEGTGQLHIEQLQPLLLGRQAEDLFLETLVLLLQRVEGLEHLYNIGSHLSVAMLLQEELYVGAGWRDVFRATSDPRAHALPLVKQ